MAGVTLESGDTPGWRTLLTRSLSAVLAHPSWRRRRRVARTTPEMIAEHARLLQTVIDNAPIIIWAWDTQGTYLLSEGKGLEQLNRPPGWSVGRSVFDLYRHNPVALAAAERALRGERFTTVVEIAGRILECRYSPVHDSDGAFVGVIGVSTDITERTALEHQLTYQALHDPLTDLPNRTLFSAHLEHALARSQRQPTFPAVLFIDLDRFKAVNDSLGHAAGDLLLTAIAERLNRCIRPGDMLARLSGDEFAVLLEDLDDARGATRVAERMIQAIQAPFVIQDVEVVITASIGIALPTSPSDRPDELLRAADVAMINSKRAGYGQSALFDPIMHTRALERLQLEGALRHAVSRAELRVHYQPIVDLNSGHIVGLEALARWERPRRGLIPPDLFIPLAEETGLILPIGRWLLAEACRQCSLWQRRIAGLSRLELSVNLSVREFQHPDLLSTIAQILAETRLNPASLRLELTESSIMQEAETTIVRLRQLKELGVKLAIDDFGTSYSSLNYLRHFPVDGLKIDRSFVAGLGQNTEDTAIVRAVINLARTLALGVTAEGVEKSTQLAELQALGCEHGQGYYFSQPLSAEEIERLLTSPPPPVAALSQV